MKSSENLPLPIAPDGNGKRVVYVAILLQRELGVLLNSGSCSRTQYHLLAGVQTFVCHLHRQIACTTSNILHIHAHRHGDAGLRVMRPPDKPKFITIGSPIQPKLSCFPRYIALSLCASPSVPRHPNCVAHMSSRVLYADEDDGDG